METPYLGLLVVETETPYFIQISVLIRLIKLKFQRKALSFSSAYAILTCQNVKTAEITFQRTFIEYSPMTKEKYELAQIALHRQESLKSLWKDDKSLTKRLIVTISI